MIKTPYKNETDCHTICEIANHQARYLPFFFVGQQSVYLLNDLDLVFVANEELRVYTHTHTHICRGERDFCFLLLFVANEELRVHTVQTALAF